MPTKRTAFGYTYYSYSLHDWRKLRSLDDIPRAHWSILQRPATKSHARTVAPVPRLSHLHLHSLRYI